MVRQVATLIVAAAVFAVPQAAAKEPLAPKTVFGIAWNNRQTSVAELDALTLQPVSKAAQLGKAGWYLGRSPGGGMRAASACRARSRHGIPPLLASLRVFRARWLRGSRSLSRRRS